MTQPYAAPLPPYAIHAPVAQQPRELPRQALMAPSALVEPAIRFKPEPGDPGRTIHTGRNAGMIFAGAVLLFSSVLLVVAFVVQARIYVGLDAHWTANVSLTAEARELGLRAVKTATLLRMGVFGPSGLLLAISGVVALVLGARRPAR